MAVKKEDVLAYLENANMMEVSELISEIEEKFGVSAAAPVAVAAAPAGGAGVPRGASGAHAVDRAGGRARRSEGVRGDRREIRRSVGDSWRRW